MKYLKIIECFWRNQKNSRANILLLLIACFFLFKFPILILLISSIFIIFKNGGAARLVAFATLLFVIYLINSTKSIDGDLEIYLNLQKIFSRMSLLTILAADNDINLYSGSFRNSEFVGYFIYWFIATHISEGKAAFEILSLSLIYIPGIIAISIISRNLNLNKAESSIAYLSFIFYCVNPALVTHVARQYAAGSFFLLAMALYIDKKMLVSFITLFFAIFIHNSVAVILCEGLIVYNLFMRYKSQISFFTLLDLRFWMLLFFTSALLLAFLAQNPNLILQDDGRVSYLSVIIDSTMLILFRNYGIKYYNEKIVFVVASVSFGLILISVISLILDMKIISLRFYFYLELMRFFGVVLVYREISRRFGAYKSIIAYLLVVLFVAHFFLKLQFSPFSFANEGLLLPFSGLELIGNSMNID